MTTLRWLSVCILSCLLSGAAAQDAGKPRPQLADERSAHGILSEMGRAYSECKSYHDTGSVQTIFTSSRGNRTVLKTFKTAFVRPDRFRFEFQEEPATRYIIASDGKSVQTWWTLLGRRTPPSLEQAVSGAGGVSSRSSYIVSTLLLPDEIAIPSLLTMTGLERLDDQNREDGDVPCFRIRGTYGDNTFTLWIDRATGLLRELDHINRFDDFTAAHVMSWDPVLDAEIEDAALAFGAPGD